MLSPQAINPPVQVLGRRPRYDGGTETMFRLSRPLPDRLPERRNVLLIETGLGTRILVGARAYERANGSWAPAPGYSWVQCFADFTAAERHLFWEETGIWVA